MLAAAPESAGLFLTLGTLAAGATLLAVHYLTGTDALKTAGGWVLLASAALAWYTAGAMMLEGTYGRVILPLGKLRREANVPGRRMIHAIEYPDGEPGVRHGQ